MTHIKRTFIINFSIIFMSCIIVSTFVIHTSRNGYGSLDIAVRLAFITLIQFFINLIFSIKIFSKDPIKKEYGKSYLLNAILVLLVGFPSCLFSSNSYIWFR